MNTVITENFISDVIKEFNQRYPLHKDELKVFSNNDTELMFSFHGIEHLTSSSELHHNFGLENLTDDDLLWLNITDLFSHMVSVYERDNLGETVNELTEIIKVKLVEISQKADIDINTLWISFKSSMEDLEKEIKKEYM